MVTVLGVVALVVGVLGGMSGIGGFLMPPVMIEFLGVSPHLAMAMTQASFIIPSTLGVRMYVSGGSMDWRLAAPFAAAGCLFSFLGAWWAKPRVDGALLSLLLGVVIIVAGYCLLRPVRAAGLGGPRPPGWVWTIEGAAVGLFAGMTGSGANALIVPTMIMGGLDALTVVAACYLFSLFTSISGSVGNIANLDMDWGLVAVMTAGQLVGTWAGVRLAQRLPVERLKRAIAILCLFSGLFVTVKNLFAVLAGADF